MFLCLEFGCQTFFLGELGIEVKGEEVLESSI